MTAHQKKREELQAWLDFYYQTKQYDRIKNCKDQLEKHRKSS